MKKNKVSVVEGTASLAEGTFAPDVRVTLKNGEVQTLTSDAVILATGARPLTVPSKGLMPDGSTVWTYREAMARCSERHGRVGALIEELRPKCDRSRGDST